MGLLGPLVLLGVVFAFVETIGKRRNLSNEARLFLCSSLPLVLLVIGVSLRKRVYVNWPMPIYIGGLFLLAYMFARDEDFFRRFRKLVVSGIAVNALIFLSATMIAFGSTFWVPGAFLPTKKLFGWEDIESINGYLVKVGAVVYYEKKFSFGKKRFNYNNIIVQNFIKEKRGSHKILFFSKNRDFTPKQKFSFLTYGWVTYNYVGLFFGKKRLEQIQYVLDNSNL